MKLSPELVWSPGYATDDELADEIRHVERLLAEVPLPAPGEYNLNVFSVRDHRRRYLLKLEHLQAEQERRRLHVAIETALDELGSRQPHVQELLREALDIGGEGR